MAAAQVSGIAALMLQASPGLTNDQVKYRLMATAKQSMETATNTPTYTVWEQGAGLVSTQQAVFSTATDRANAGMDIGMDLTSTTHYWGNTTWNEAKGQFEVVNPQTGEMQVWDGGFRAWSGGFRAWSGGFRAWSGGFRAWSGSTSTWASSESMWAGGFRAWSGSVPATSLSTASQAELLVNDP